MGGVATVPVVCDDYTIGSTIDTKFEEYLTKGLIFETDGMLEYSWALFGMYIYDQNAQSYMTALSALIDCGI